MHGPLDRSGSNGVPLDATVYCLDMDGLMVWSFQRKSGYGGSMKERARNRSPQHAGPQFLVPWSVPSLSATTCMRGLDCCSDFKVSTNQHKHVPQWPLEDFISLACECRSLRG